MLSPLAVASVMWRESGGWRVLIHVDRRVSWASGLMTREGPALSCLWAQCCASCNNRMRLSDHVVCLHVGLEPADSWSCSFVVFAASKCRKMRVRLERLERLVRLSGARAARWLLAARELSLGFPVQGLGAGRVTEHCLQLGLGHFPEAS